MKFEFKSVQKPAKIPTEQWSHWTWQFKNALKTQPDFERYLTLTEDEKLAFSQLKDIFQTRTTPYYAQIANPLDIDDPIRKTMLPHAFEMTEGAQQMFDPLGENDHRPAERIIHRYPDRALFLVTDFCSVYCRYCTRKHFTGKDQAVPSLSAYDEALSYIKRRPGIREVILSGGDPLTLSNNKLNQILSDLRSIEHLEIIRIGTRIPIVCPFRIDQDLVDIMKRYQPIYMMLHFNHPKEITLDSKKSLDLLANNGFPLFNQMVLLNGINNHPAVVQALSRRLLYLRVKPYYMFQCDPSEGTDHLRTSIEESEAIKKELWGRLSGLAMPNLSLDIPNGGGKVGITPDFEIFRSDQFRTYRGWDGRSSNYVNPDKRNLLLPSDFSEYEKEWKLLKEGEYGVENRKDQCRDHKTFVQP